VLNAVSATDIHTFTISCLIDLLPNTKHQTPNTKHQTY